MESLVVDFAFYERGFIFFRNSVVELALNSFVFIKKIPYELMMIDFGFFPLKRFNLLPAAEKLRGETRKGAWRKRRKKRENTKVFSRRPV